MHDHLVAVPPQAISGRPILQRPFWHWRLVPACLAFGILSIFQKASAEYIEPTWHPHNGSGSYTSPALALQAAKDNWDIQWAAHVNCRTWGASYWGETGNYGSNLGGCAGGGVAAVPSCPTAYNYDQQKHKCWDGIEEPDEGFKGPPTADTCAGNPINITNGNKFQSETDYRFGGYSRLSFSRSYNSLDGLWRHNFSSRLLINDTGKITLVEHHGREQYFTSSGNTITPTSAGLGVLSRTSDGWQFLSSDNSSLSFDTTGKLVEQSDDQGAVYSFDYSNNQITVTDHAGASFSFQQDANLQPLSLSAPGTQISYDYDVHQRLTSLVRIAGNQNTQRAFHYEIQDEPNLLTGITDERGIRYATWFYDAEGRAISSEHAGGADRVEIAYNNDGSTTVTNELGKQTTYRFQTLRGIKRVTAIEGEPSVNCPSSNSLFTYGANGLLKTKTDNQGIVTSYLYNERGLEISRTEASGMPEARTTVTEWHPSRFIPLRTIEPNQITYYQYDSQGRQLSRILKAR